MKYIIDIPEDVYKNILQRSTEIQAEGYVLECAVLNATPLDDISEQAEVQTYLAGYIKGCEQGREDLIDEVLNKVSEIPTYERDGCWVKNDVYRVLEEIIRSEE